MFNQKLMAWLLAQTAIAQQSGDFMQHLRLGQHAQHLAYLVVMHLRQLSWVVTLRYQLNYRPS